MNNYENIINFAMIAILIIVVVHFLFRNYKNNLISNEEFNLEEPCLSQLHKKNALPPSGKIYNFHDPKSNVKQSVNCPIEKNQKDNDFYVQKILLGNNEVCPKKTKSKKD